MNKRIIAYSLLAHINNAIKTQSTFDQIFVPLVKRALSKMCAGGTFKGNDLMEIKAIVEELYGLDMPTSVLKILVEKIVKEVNIAGKTVFILYQDQSFIIDKYVFEDFEEEIAKKDADLEKLESLYKSFVNAEGKNPVPDSLFTFIEQNKFALGSYIGKKYQLAYSDNTSEARFVNFIKDVPDLYNVLQSVYIGSIISNYLEYQPSLIKQSVELVLDTNFIISLIDLNTPSSTSNCQRLLQMGEKLGYRFTVLDITLREIDRLLNSRIEYYDLAFLSRQLDPEDIYNACDRRKLSKTDLNRIRQNLSSEIAQFNVTILPHTDKYEKIAKFSDIYEKLKDKRNTDFAALHDATCMMYVREKRVKLVYEFTKVNCWFINNSSSRGRYHTNGAQPEQIKAEELLNLLWLSTPALRTKISGDEISSIGLSRLVSATLDNSLPNAITIRRLDENIRKYAKDNISDDDVILVSKSIAERTITNVDGLNEQAENNPAEFIGNLLNIADQQKKKEDRVKNMFEHVLDKVKKEAENLKLQTGKIEEERQIYQTEIKSQKEKETEYIESSSILLEQNKKLKRQNIDLLNAQREPKRKKYIRNKILLWQFKGTLIPFVWLTVSVACVIYVWNLGKGNVQTAAGFWKSYQNNILIAGAVFLINSIITGIFYKICTDRFSVGNKSAFEKALIIPEEFKHLEYED